MPISINTFKDYCSFPVVASNGLPSRGLVSVRRVNLQSQNIIPIPVNTVFSVSTGQSFKNLERAELNQSQAFIPLVLTSVNIGRLQNIPANSQWNTPVAGIALLNTQPFSGGVDAVAESNTTGFILDRLNQPSDSVLQLVLDQSTKVCLGMAGLSSPPNTMTFEASVYFLGRYYLETRSKTQKQDTQDFATGWEEKLVNPGIEDKKVHEGVMRVLTGMLTPDRRVTDFMPEVQNESD